MQKNICLYFEVHQPRQLRLYRFFDIGKDSHYYDDYACRTLVKRLARDCYMPMNEILLRSIEKHKGKFRLAFSISGSALEMFDRYAPEVIDSFRRLVDTGCVEMLAETYYHSLSSLVSPQEFSHQVSKHVEAVKKYFGVKPVSFRNTELIYSDAIGSQVAEMGFKTMLTEGARHILGWKSPGYVYESSQAPGLKLLLRNYTLSDDITLRFSEKSWGEWPLTADKYASWLASSDGEIAGMFMDYETFGEYHAQDSGIADFLKCLPDAVLAEGSMAFVTPSQAGEKMKAADTLEVPEPISWADEERDVSAWLGNELQQEAFNKLYGLTEKLSLLGNPVLWEDFGHLTESDHFYYMCTKFFNERQAHRDHNPYGTPYDAFINYMNVLSDFIIRVNEEYATKN